MEKAKAIEPNSGRAMGSAHLCGFSGCIMPIMASSGQGYDHLNAQLLVDSIPALIHTARPDGYLDYFNKPWLEYLGVSLEKVTGWNWTAFVHPEDVEGIVAKWRGCLATGESFEYETRVRRADGDYRWMFHRKVPLRDANGNIVKWYGSSLDIDERKTAEEALRNSQAYLAEAQRLSHTGSWANSANGPKYWSEECYRVLGFDPAEPLPSLETIFQRIHQDDRAAMREQLERGIRDKTDFEVDLRIVHPSTGIRNIRSLCHAVLDARGDLRELVGTIIDITEHRRAEEANRRSEAYLAEAQRLSHTGSFGWRPDTGEIVWSDETYRIFEYDRSVKPTIDSAVQRIHPEDRADVREVINRAFAGATDFEHAYRLLLPDGRVKHVHAKAHVLQDASGKREYVGAVTDVTEQRHAEVMIRQKEAELREVVDTIPAIVWSTLPDGSNTYVNKRFVEYSGSSAEQMAGSGWKGLIHPDDLERHIDKWMDAIATGKPLENEVRSRRSDGQYRWQLDRGVPLRDEDGNIVKWYGVTTDIEDRRRAEEALGVLSRDLQENTAKLEEAQRVAHVGYWEWNLRTDHVTWSDETYRIYGLHPQECPIELATIKESIHPEDREIVFRKAAEAVQGEMRVDAEHRIVRPNGEVRVVHSQGDLKERGRPSVSNVRYRPGHY